MLGMKKRWKAGTLQTNAPEAYALNCLSVSRCGSTVVVDGAVMFLKTLRANNGVLVKWFQIVPSRSEVALTHPK